MFFPTVPPLFVQIDLAPTILLDVHYVYYEQKISFPNMLEISIYECSIQGHAKHTVGKKKLLALCTVFLARKFQVC